MMVHVIIQRDSDHIPLFFPLTSDMNGSLQQPMNFSSEGTSDLWGQSVSAADRKAQLVKGARAAGVNISIDEQCAMHVVRRTVAKNVNHAYSRLGDDNVKQPQMRPAVRGNVSVQTTDWIDCKRLSTKRQTDRRAAHDWDLLVPTLPSTEATSLRLHTPNLTLLCYYPARWKSINQSIYPTPMLQGAKVVAPSNIQSTYKKKNPQQNFYSFWSPFHLPHHHSQPLCS